MSRASPLPRSGDRSKAVMMGVTTRFLLGGGSPGGRADRQGKLTETDGEPVPYPVGPPGCRPGQGQRPPFRTPGPRTVLCGLRREAIPASRHRAHDRPAPAAECMSQVPGPPLPMAQAEALLGSEQDVAGGQRSRDVVEQDRHLRARVRVSVQIDRQVRALLRSPDSPAPKAPPASSVKAWLPSTVTSASIEVSTMSSGLRRGPR